MDAPYCKVEFHEIKIGISIKGYMYLALIGVLFTGMYLFNYDLLKLMMTGELPW